MQKCHTKIKAKLNCFGETRYFAWYLNLDKALLFPGNQVICLKNWKFEGALTTIEFNASCWKFAHVSHLPVSTKECSKVSIFLGLELYGKLKKELVSTHSERPGFFFTFANNLRSKQNQKYFDHPSANLAK